MSTNGIQVVPSVTAAAAAATPSGLLSLDEAKRNVARVLGGDNDDDVLDAAEEAILASLEEFRLWQWDFLRKTATLSLVAGTGDYTLASDLDKVYDVRLTNRPLEFVPQREFDRYTTNQPNGYVFGWNVFPGTSVEDADPQHSVQTMRFIYTPDASDTATYKYYRAIVVITSGGATIDLPRKYQWWAIYNSKAMLLADHGGNTNRFGFWQAKADRLLQRAKNDDAFQPDDDLGFRAGQIGVFDAAHPAFTLYALDGF